MDPKHNSDQNKPDRPNQESQHNKSNAGHKEQGQREGQQTEQKKRSGLS